MDGFAYVFLRKDAVALPTGDAGHVGWGFTTYRAPGDLDAIYGATENPSGSIIVLPGGDIGYWDARSDHEAEMVFAFKQRNYHAFKKAKVEVAWPDNALAMARQQSLGGYEGIGNNCLDHVWRTLNAYGVKDLPLAQFHPAPNDWFAQFNGAYMDIL